MFTNKKREGINRFVCDVSLCVAEIPQVSIKDHEPLFPINPFGIVAYGFVGQPFSKQLYIEDITRWREDMNFMFEWQEQYLTSKRSERVRYCSCHENIKFISSSQRVMLFLLYGETNSTKAKGGNRDVIERYDTHKGDIQKIRHSGPG